MNTKKYTKEMIYNVTTLEELESLKSDFINECTKRENKIKVSNLLSKIDNFNCAKTIFESMIPSLLPKKEGKSIIKNYVKIIKENKSLKTIYSYCEGLSENTNSDSKKAYIVEALSIGNPIHYNEYVLGLGKVVNIIAESFKILGDEYVLNNITLNEKSKLIGESLLYLTTTKKSVKNLNEYFSHIDTVCENITRDNKKEINLDSTLEELISEMHNKNNDNVNNIFETNDKEKTFKEEKNKCLSIIKKQIKENVDKEIVERLTEIEDKLNKKTYKYDTFTKDMLYMNELQELLK